MDRLLTDEEIEDVSTTCLFREDCLLESTLGGTITVNVLQAQDAKTLKAVGEWLDSSGEYDHEDSPYNTDPNKDTRWYFRLYILAEKIDQLKQGKMPE